MTCKPLVLSLYRVATFFAAPLSPLFLLSQRIRGLESWSRIGERYGYASRARPKGRLIWIHAASDGECNAALPLIGMLRERNLGKVMLTCINKTAAETMARQLPAGAFHQYVPLDTHGAVTRFLKHWRPDLLLFIDTDCEPNLVMKAHAMGIPIAVVNARMEKFSFRRWLLAPKSGHAISSMFDAVLAQDKVYSARFRAVGARDVRVTGSLKADAAPLAADEAELARLRAAVGSRPVFLAAQTHGGEERILLSARDKLMSRYPDLLTVIVPRRVIRGRRLRSLCGARACARRSLGEAVTPETAIYIADTTGELGLFYRLATFAFVGGSLIPLGGQNPLEPAKLGCAVLAGPHVFNFSVFYRTIHAAQGTRAVASAAEIAEAAGQFLAAPHVARSLGRKAAAAVAGLTGATPITADYVEGVMKRMRSKEKSRSGNILHPRMNRFVTKTVSAVSRTGDAAEDISAA